MQLQKRKMKDSLEEQLLVFKEPTTLRGKDESQPDVYQVSKKLFKISGVVGSASLCLGQYQDFIQERIVEFSNRYQVDSLWVRGSIVGVIVVYGITLIGSAWIGNKNE